jgi:hypothetical protein
MAMVSNYIENSTGAYPEIKDVPSVQENISRPAALLATVFFVAATTSMGAIVQHTDPRILSDYRPLPVSGSRNGDAQTTVQCMSRIREVFKPSVTELATLFGVTRQTVYNWQAGHPVNTENFARLRDLANAAIILEEQGLAGKSHVLRRSLPGGGTLFDHVRRGDSATEAASALVEMVLSESDRLEELKAQMVKQSRPQIDTEELGLPFLSEHP